MPWTERVLRGQRVLARCDASGALVASDGRVEIRYKPNDGRAYQALAGNLTPASGASILPDEHCGPAGEVPKKQAETKKTSAGAKKSSKSEGATEPGPAAEGEVTVYADGACSGNPGPAGLGVVVYEEDGKRELSEYLGVATNNIAELTAILRVAELFRGDPKTLVIHTDSQYSIGVLSKGWKAKANVELVAEVKKALAQVRTRLVYVRGHAGIAGNERADELARAAVTAEATSGWKRYAKKRPEATS